ncbi:MAG: PDZ domain-containing protein [Candidatus Methanoperedens sp.]|nr:PDZ domain-containing protein [Candidatus Methanoperedens sp.]
MPLKDLFRLTKEKIMLDFILSLALVISVLSIPSFGFQEIFLNREFTQQILAVTLSVLFAAIIYYPFTCGLIFIYRRVAKKTEKEIQIKMDLAVAIVLILISNPISIGLIYSGLPYANNSINEPCGVEITGFAESSPAKSAGMAAGEVIVAADGSKIDTSDALLHALANKKPGDYVPITTGVKDYNIQIAEDPETHRAVLGIRIQDKYCRR